jgi:hypothetical protein
LEQSCFGRAETSNGIAAFKRIYGLRNWKISALIVEAPTMTVTLCSTASGVSRRCSAIRGTYDGKRFYLDVLSCRSEDKDPGNIYYEGQFLTAKQVEIDNSRSDAARRRHFVPFGDLTNVAPPNAGVLALRKGQELRLPEEEIVRLTVT